MYNRISIKLSVDKGQLRVALPKIIFDKRKYLYLGLSDNPFNRELAANIIKMMESDYYFDKFDFSLNKYEVYFKTRKLSAKIIKQALIRWGHLKIKEVPKSTRNYITFINLIEKAPAEIIKHPEQFRAWLLETCPVN